MPILVPSKSRIRALYSGFTLVEMAVVVVVMGILLTLGLRMTQATQNNAAWAETKLKQDRIKVALIAFMRTNGRLPCPDAALPPTGLAPANCLVNAGRGVLPWVTLGLSVNDVQDGWSNFFTYRVANGTPGGRNWTLRAGATAFTLAEFTTPLAALTIRERNDLGVLNPIPLTSNAVVAIVSHGKNGLGARTLRGAAVIPLAAAGADEVINATTAQTTFITRTPTDAAATGGTFDDVVTYMTPQDVLQPLVSERSLFGACASYCRPPPAVCPAVPLPTCNATNIPVGAATIAACPCVASLALPQ